MVKLTPKEKQLEELLSDGLEHTTDEIIEAIGDDYMDMLTIRVHISNLRKKIKPTKRGILSRRSYVNTLSKTTYQLVHIAL